MKNGSAIFSSSALKLFMASRSQRGCSHTWLLFLSLPAKGCLKLGLPLGSGQQKAGEETPFGHSGEAAGIKAIS